MPECMHYWVPIAAVTQGLVKSCAFCEEMSYPEAFDITDLVVTRSSMMGLGVYSEQDELLDRLNRRWVDGIDPGLPARVERLLR